MMTRSQLYRLALDAHERRANVRDFDVLPIPTLDERATLYLRAIHGNRDFTEEERSNARDGLLNSMAADMDAQVIPAEQSAVRELPGRKTTHRADRESLLGQYAAQYWHSVQRKETAKRRTSILALMATFALVVIVTGGILGYRWTHPHMADEVTPAAKKEDMADQVTPGAKKMDMADEITPAAKKADRLGLNLPKPGPAQEAANEAAPEQQVTGQLTPQSVWQQPVPTVQIISQRSEADVLAVFRRLQEEQPSLFGQATLMRSNIVENAKPTEAKPTGSPTASPAARAKPTTDLRGLRSPGSSPPDTTAKPIGRIVVSVVPHPYVQPPAQSAAQPAEADLRLIFTAQVGPFASLKDAWTACGVFQAADIRCVGFSGLK
jgi:hypothetical protein